MREDLEFIQKTFEINREEIESSTTACDELITSDLMRLIGYDRRRNKGVKRVSKPSGECIWNVNNNNLNIQVITIPYKNIEKFITNKKCDTYIEDESDIDYTILIDGCNIALIDNKSATVIIKKELFRGDKDTEELLKAISNSGNITDYVRNLMLQNIKSQFSQDINTVNDWISNEECAKHDIQTLDIINILKEIIDEYKNNTALDTDSTNNNNNAELNRLNNEKDNLTKHIELLNSKITNLEAEIDRLRQVNISQETEIVNLKQANLSQEAEINKFTDQTKSLAITASGSSENNLSNIGYIKQVEQLTLKLANANEELDKKDALINELKCQIENKVDPRITESQTLIDAIEPDEDDTKSYVGVVNGNLYQAQTVERFIGQSIQELYKCVTFDLMPYLFDGDIFNISDKPIRNDMLIGNKLYDIDIESIGEEESILRLKTLFSKFPSVIFMYKIIGSKPIVDDKNDAETYIEPNNEDSSDYLLEPNLKNDIMSLNRQVFAIPLNNLTDFANVLPVRLSDISMIAYGKGEIIPYRIDTSNDTSALKSLILSIINFSNATSKPRIIGQFNFENKYDFIKIIENERDKEFVRIPFTQYSVQSTNMIEAIQLIFGLADMLNVDTNSILVYCIDESVVPDDELSRLDIGILHESDINLSGWELTIPNNEELEVGKDRHCIVGGNMSYFLYDSGIGTLDEIGKQIISGVLAVKNSDMSVSINTSEYSSITNIIIEMARKNEISLDILANQLGYIEIKQGKFKIISRYEHDVTPDNYSFEYEGQNYFISKMCAYDLLKCLIETHIITNGNRSIGIRVTLNYSYLEFYTNKYINYDPNVTCSVKSMIEYLAEHIKN